MSFLSEWKTEAEQILIETHHFICGQSLRKQTSYVTSRYIKFSSNQSGRLSWRNILKTTTISTAKKCKNGNCAFIGNERDIRSLLRLLLLNNLNADHISRYENQTTEADYLKTLMIHTIGPRFNGKKASFSFNHV